MSSGTLYVVATPIGNLEDITLRALRILKEVECVLAEDTRHTHKLLSAHGIPTPTRAFHQHSSDASIHRIIGELQNGARFALVTDAGVPAISDPGAELVDRAHAVGIHVESVPGASALTTALSLCGLRVTGHRFVGFLPRSGERRREALREIEQDALATVLFEAANRTHETLDDLGKFIGSQRRVAVCRELTKLHEEITRGSVSEVSAKLASELKGEVTIVIEGRDPKEAESEAAQNERGSIVQSRAEALHAAGKSTRDVADTLFSEGLCTRREAYRIALGLK